MKKEEGFPGQISFVIPDRVVSLLTNNPLIADLYITDIGYYPKAQFHFRNRPSGSSQFILIYCTDGQGEIHVNQNMQTITSGNYFIIPAGCSHSYHADKRNPWSIYWIHFSGSKSAFFFKYANQSISIDHGKTSRKEARLELFWEIFSNLERGFSTETLEFVNLCLPYLLGSFIHAGPFNSVTETKENDSVDLCINFMLENLTKKLKVKDIALVIGYSTPHFCRLFLSKTGHSPIDYFIQLKIQRSCRLLDNSGLTVADVAYEMGFEDQFYFSRLFRKVMGMPPSEYRKARI